MKNIEFVDFDHFSLSPLAEAIAMKYQKTAKFHSSGSHVSHPTNIPEEVAKRIILHSAEAGYFSPSDYSRIQKSLEGDKECQRYLLIIAHKEFLEDLRQWQEEAGLSQRERKPFQTERGETSAVVCLSPYSVPIVKQIYRGPKVTKVIAAIPGQELPYFKKKDEYLSGVQSLIVSIPKFIDDLLR